MFLDPAPTLDSLTHLRLEGLWYVVTGGFARRATIADIQMGAMFGAAMVAAATSRAAGAIGLRKSSEDCLAGQLLNFLKQALAQALGFLIGGFHPLLHCGLFFRALALTMATKFCVKTQPPT